MTTAGHGHQHAHPDDHGHGGGGRDHRGASHAGHRHEDHGHGHGGHDHPGGLKGLVLRVVRPHSHDAADSLDSAVESSAEGIRALKVSLLVLLATALTQLAIVLLTGSVALLADTIHNFSDALTAIPLWVAFALSRRAATRRYTYGYGRFEDIAGLFVVAVILLSSVLAGYESVRRLISPHTLDYPWVVLAAGVVGFLGNELAAVYRIRVGRKIGSAALAADGLHARADGFTSLAVAAGAVGALLGFQLADPIVGILIMLAIVVVLKNAARDIYRRLMDAVEPEVMDAAEASLRAVPGVIGVEQLRMRWIGHRLRAEVDVAVAGTLDVTAAHAIAHGAQHQLMHDVPKLADANVHVSPRGRAGAAAEAVAAHHHAEPGPPLGTAADADSTIYLANR
jgi:cation diffusion facilitator family transporter